MKKASFTGKLFVLLAILVLPSLAYLLMTTGQNNFKKLPYLWPQSVDEKGDTVFQTIPPFSFVDQNGNTVSDKDLEGKIFIASFFFASCQGPCPKITTQLARVQERYKAVRDLRILSFTVDPERDSVNALGEYGRKFMVNPRKWSLLTGDKKEIYDLAMKGFFANAGEGMSGTADFIHTENVMLIDKEKKVRGMYSGTDPKEIDRLMDEVTVLLTEYKTKK
jgi:protein SCO1/2